MTTYDTIIIGLGAMGSAAAWRCAQRGQRVLGLEQCPLVHNLGSSHGRTRIIREAYYEHPAYVPLVREAYRGWAELQERSPHVLLTRERCANIGPSGCGILEGVAAAAKEHQLPVQYLTARELMCEYPVFAVPDHYEAIVENNAGSLSVERCVEQFQQQAKLLGATLHAEETVVRWQASGRSVTVETTKGIYEAGELILTAGPWSRDILQLAGTPLTIMRQLQWFFQNPLLGDSPLKLPIFLLDTPNGSFYGIQDSRSIKVAQHYGASELRHPDEVNRLITDDEIQPVRKFMQQHLPALRDAPLEHASVCLYTLTPDRHFIIDRHPEYVNVAFACGFSGHGFKFAPVVGTMLADLTEDQDHDVTPSLFRLARFSA
jgi:sarcosine oxidase